MTIAGALHFVGEAPDLARSLNAMAFGPGKPRFHREPDAVFGGCDDGEIAVDGAITAVFSGRLDDIGDIRQRSAAHATIQAYRRWGETFSSHMIGDFACAIWDGSTRRLLLARDPFGAEPLHFSRDGGAILFATEPQGLLAFPSVPREVDQRWIMRWLALLPQNEPVTAYRGIERVLPGHVAIFADKDVRQVQIWRPEELPPVRLASDADYADTARALLDQAIRCRIAGVDAVGSHLSAGLDSSSVTVLAARQLAERGQKLTSFTAVPMSGFDSSPGRDRIWDEGPLAKCVADTYPNIDHLLIPNEGRPLFDICDQVGASAGMPVVNVSNQGWNEGIGREAQRRGIRVMLNAGKGNMSISYEGYGALPMWARNGRWITLSRQLAALHRRGDHWPFLVNRTILPILPPALRRGIRRLLGRPEERVHEFSALNLTLAKHLGVLDEAVAMAGNVGNIAPAEDVRLAVLRRVDPGMGRRTERRRFGFRLYDPMTDRRLVEFCLAIPPEQFMLHGERRSLVRRAMAGILPDAVRLEQRRGLQAADWAHRLHSERDEIAAEITRLERSPLASSCLDVPRLRRLIDEWPNTGWDRPGVAREYGLALTRGVATGRFLRRLEGGNE